jgi:hypothetical protein
MRKLLFGIFLGSILGVAASAVAETVAKTGGPCGPTLICSENHECCVSPAPFTYRCVAVGSCRYN